MGNCPAVWAAWRHLASRPGAESERQASAAHPSIVELTIKSMKQRYPKAFGGKKTAASRLNFETLTNNLTHAMFLGSIGNCEN
ncbi:MAG: hypothetical protein E5Y74_14255 [Mesorhizobium sp.]|nr:MAG: hypothetical protein E5Y74_14255 [Mesorhizobium sp.]